MVGDAFMSEIHELEEFGARAIEKLKELFKDKLLAFGVDEIQRSTASLNSRIAELREAAKGQLVVVNAANGRAEAAETRVAELEKALEPFAALTDGCDHFQKADDEYVCVFHIQGRRVAATAAQCRLARAALSTGAPG
jgi:hypothetical protein